MVIENDLYFRNMQILERTPEFRKLLNAGIITKVVRTINYPHVPLIEADSPQVFLSLNDGGLSLSNRRVVNRRPDVHFSIRANRMLGRVLVHSANKVNVYVLNFDKILNNMKLDFVEVAGIIYTVFTSDILGVFFCLYGVMKNLARAGSTTITEDAGAVFSYFKIKLAKYKMVTKEILSNTYDEFKKEVKLDSKSKIGSFTTIFDKLTRAGLIKRIGTGTYKLQSCFGLHQMNNDIKSYINARGNKRFKKIKR